MRQRAIDGWPDHWYNRDGLIPCPARGCTKVFNSGNIRWRGHHWYDHEPGSPSYSDHAILLAIHRQEACVYCPYRNDASLKDLLAHEQTQHGTNNMSTIPGYLRLMRHGLNTHTDEARVCRGEAYKRLKLNIWNSPYRDRLLSRGFPQVMPHQHRGVESLDPILSHQNYEAGRPHAVVILARDFLTHLRPQPRDHAGWHETYHALRALYAEGRI